MSSRNKASRGTSVDLQRQTVGKVVTINSQSIRVLDRDASGLVLRCTGTVTITDAGAGYAKGCQYIKTDGGVATTYFINEGSTSSCDFNAMETSASTITAVVAGSALTGGGTEGSVTLNVAVDDVGIEINTDALRLKDLGVTSAKLGADAVADASKIADDAVSLEHLDAGITPGFLVIDAGLFTTIGGDANESITSANCLGTDTVLVWVQKAGAVPRTVDTITPGAGSIAVVMSDDPSNDHKLNYVVYRAPA